MQATAAEAAFTKELASEVDLFRCHGQQSFPAALNQEPRIEALQRVVQKIGRDASIVLLLCSLDLLALATPGRSFRGPLRASERGGTCWLESSRCRSA